MEPQKTSQSTPQTSGIQPFDLTLKNLFVQQPQGPLSVPTLSGLTTISQGNVSVVDTLKQKLPQTFFGDVVRGLFEAPKTLAENLGFTDESQMQKLDRLANALIVSGIDSKRAYEIAGLDVQKNTGNYTQMSGAIDKYNKLGVTPAEEKILDPARTMNNFMTALTVAGAVPGVGTVENKFAKTIVGGVEKTLPKTLAEQLDYARFTVDNMEGSGVKERVSTLSKYLGKTGEFKGELNFNNGKGVFGKEGDTIMRNIYDPYITNTKTGEEMAQQFYAERQAYQKAKENLARLEREARAYKEAVDTSLSGRTQKTYDNLPPEIKTEVVPFDGAVSKIGKVSALDFARTPEAVYTKIGLAKEFNGLRKGWEAYTEELRKNIGKIDAWHARVPKDANVRIFDYLDGQKVVLSTEEQRVADEIKQWLSEWADRLKIPKEGRVSNYITRLFERDIKEGTIDERFKKIVEGTIPGKVFNPFLEKRIGAVGYKHDVWGALDAYINKATLQTNMDSAFKALQAKTGTTFNAKIDDLTFKYIQSHIDALQFKPADLDRLINRLFGTGTIGTSILRTLRKFTYLGTLGLRLSTSMLNLSQGVNTFAKLGTKYTTLGYAKLLQKGALEELDAIGITADSFIEDRTLHEMGKIIRGIDEGLFYFFQKAEQINRGSAYFGAKAKALASGATEREAIEAGKKLVRETQFMFGPLDNPVVMRSELAKTFLQFQSYNIKQSEFLIDMLKNTVSGNEKLKNFAGALRYAIGGYFFITQIGKVFGMEPQQLLPGFRFGIPPSLQAPVEGVKALLDTKDKYGRERDTKQKLKDVGNAFIGLIPAGKQIKTSIQGYQAIKEGGSFTSGDKLKFQTPTTLGGKVQTFLFGPNTTEEAQNYFDRAKTKTEEQKIMMPTYQKVQELISQGKKDEAKAIVDSLSDKQWQVYKDIKASENSKKTAELQKQVLPIYRQIQQLKNSGKTDEAVALANSLSEEQWQAYLKLKKSLEN